MHRMVARPNDYWKNCGLLLIKIELGFKDERILLSMWLRNSLSLRVDHTPLRLYLDRWLKAAMLSDLMVNSHTNACSQRKGPWTLWCTSSFRVAWKSKTSKNWRRVSKRSAMVFSLCYLGGEQDFSFLKRVKDLGRESISWTQRENTNNFSFFSEPKINFFVEKRKILRTFYWIV